MAATKIKKVTSKWIIETNEGILEFDNLADAEKRFLNVIRGEMEGYLIRKDYIGEKLVEEILVG
jgi:hypothetical protein